MPQPSQPSLDLQEPIKRIQDYLAQIPRLEQECSSLQAKKQLLKSSVDQLETRLKDANQRLDAELQSKRDASDKELADLDAAKRAVQAEIDSLTDKKSQIGLEIQAEQDKLPAIRGEVLEQQDAVRQAAGKVAGLEQQEADLKQSLATQEGLLAGARQELGEVEGRVQGQTTALSELQSQILAAQGELAVAQDEYELKKKSYDEDLRTILHKTSAAIVRLQDIESKEKMTRNEIATQRLDLEKEREALQRLKHKLSDAETTIAKYNKFMDL